MAPLLSANADGIIELWGRYWAADKRQAGHLSNSSVISARKLS